MPADHLAPPAAPCAATDPRLFTRLLTSAEADAHAQGWGGAASVLRVEDAAGRLVVARRSVPGGAHPATALLGLRAPASCVAVGVVAEGSARPVGAAGDDAGATSVGAAGDAAGATSVGAAGDDAGETSVGAAGDDAGATSVRHDGPAVPACAAATAPPAGDADRAEVGTRVRVAVLAARHGYVASVVRLGDDAPSVAVHRVPTPDPPSRARDRRAGTPPGTGRARATTEAAGRAPTGRLVDVLLRVLGMATAPPPPSTTRLWAIVWLQAVAAVGRAAPGLPWPVVAALHPARRILAGGRPPTPGAMPDAPPISPPPTPDPDPEPAATRRGSPGAVADGTPAARPPSRGAMPGATPRSRPLSSAAGATGDPGAVDATGRSLVAAGTAVGGLVTWDRLHADAAAGRWLPPGLSAADAAWLDTGAFARWVLGDLPPLRAVADAAADRLHPAVVATVDDVLAAWHLDDRDAS